MRKLRLVLTTLWVLTSTAPSYAGGGHGGHGGSSVFIGVGGFGCCFGGFGFGGFWPPFGWGYAPPPAWAYAPPPGWGYPPPAAWASVPPAMAISSPAAASPIALAGPPATSPSGAAPPPAEAVWYYCPSTSGYYPYVATCAVAWQTIPTRPPQANLVHASARPAPAPITRERRARDVADTPTEAFLRGIGGPRQGEPRVIAEFTNSSGEPCQELEHTVAVDGIKRRATAIVCERTDGHWVISTQTARAATN